jgi:hypothetical protein
MRIRTHGNADQNLGLYKIEAKPKLGANVAELNSHEKPSQIAETKSALNQILQACTVEIFGDGPQSQMASTRKRIGAILLPQT